jgi:hypothetical protein
MVALLWCAWLTDVCDLILGGLEQFSIRVWCRMCAHADERALAGYLYARRAPNEPRAFLAERMGNLDSSTKKGVLDE